MLSFVHCKKAFACVSWKKDLLTFIVRVLVELLGGLHERELAREGQLRARPASAFQPRGHGCIPAEALATTVKVHL